MMSNQFGPTFAELKKAFVHKWGERICNEIGVEAGHHRCTEGIYAYRSALLFNMSAPCSPADHAWIGWAKVVLWCLASHRIAKPTDGRVSPAAARLGITSHEQLHAAQVASGASTLNVEAVKLLVAYNDLSSLPPPPNSRFASGDRYHDPDYESLPPSTWANYNPAELYNDPTWRPYPRIW